MTHKKQGLKISDVAKEIGGNSTREGRMRGEAKPRPCYKFQGAQ